MGEVKKPILNSLREIKTFISWAKKQKISKGRLGEFEFEFHPQAFLNKRETKAFLSLLNPSPADKAREAEDDLYHSAI